MMEADRKTDWRTGERKTDTFTYIYVKYTNAHKKRAHAQTHSEILQWRQAAVSIAPSIDHWMWCAIWLSWSADRLLFRGFFPSSQEPCAMSIFMYLRKALSPLCVPTYSECGYARRSGVSIAKRTNINNYERQFSTQMLAKGSQTRGGKLKRAPSVKWQTTRLRNCPVGANRRDHRKRWPLRTVKLSHESYGVGSRRLYAYASRITRWCWCLLYTTQWEEIIFWRVT